MILRVAWLLAAAISCMSAPGRADETAEDPLDLAAGAVVLSYSSQYDWEKWSALTLIDGTNLTGWSSARQAVLPHEFVIELPGRHRLDEFSFDNRGNDERTHPGISARAVELFTSVESPTAGFRSVLAAELKQGDLTVLPLAADTEARWLKLVVRSNWGHTVYTELMELGAQGSLIAPAAMDRDVSGIYATNYGPLLLDQDGTRITGCYYAGSGSLDGDTDGRVIRFQWRQTTGLPIGSAVSVVTDSGFLNGLWYYNGGLGGTWFGPRAPAGTDANCGQAAANPVARDLEAGGRTILYGIYFALDSAVLEPESEVTLGLVRDALAVRPDWRIVVEGHTDSSGADDYNQRLSEQRAATVTAWLQAQGLDAASLRADGKGESAPVADNGTPQGRALNRRVEIRLDQ